MKKSIFYYLFAVLCSVSLFTSCSDDDEDNSWKELPTGEITASNVVLKLNGESTTGTVNFNATGLTAAQVGLKNVIDGYSDVAVDVTMDKLSDGSFKLNGQKEIATRPVGRATAAVAPLLTVTVDGTITADGKLTANVSAVGAGLYIGTYSNETLALTYGETVLTGKEVVFDATDGNNVSLLLKDVIPGEDATEITGVTVNNNGFSGTTKTTNATVEYTGNRVDKVLTLNLKVTMNDPSKWAKSYGVTEYTSGVVEGAKSRVVLTCGAYSTWMMGDKAELSIPTMVRTACGLILPQVLQSLTLEADGNITASYNSRDILIDQEKLMSILMYGKDVPTTEEVKALIPADGWQTSAKNLAYWFEKDGKLYVKLNIAEIMIQSMGAEQAGQLLPIISQVLNAGAADIKQILTKYSGIDLTGISDESILMLVDWAKNGIPLNVTSANGHTYIYLDRAAFNPLCVDNESPADDYNYGIKSDIMKIMMALIQGQMIPEEYNGIAFMLAGVAQGWPATTEFNLGLDLQAK